MGGNERADLVGQAAKHMFVTLKQAHIDAAKSDAGGWSRGQLALLGVSWPPQQGWAGTVLYKRLPGTVVAAFIRLRDEEPATTPAAVCGECKRPVG